jgi:hypothetical protein
MVSTPVSSRWTWGALVAITLLGAALRFWGIGYGLPNTLARPDEERIVGPAASVARTGSLRPGTTLFYPTLLIYADAIALASWASAGELFGRYESREDFVAREWPALPYRLCRIVSAGFGVLTVPLTFLLARRMWASSAAGLVAALAVATNYLHVRDAHFATVDVAMTFFTTLCLFFAVKAASDDRLGTWLAAGASAGFAASTKYNGALVFVAPLAAALARLRGGRPPIRRIAAAAGVAGAAYAITSPYTVILWRSTVRWLGVTQRLLYGAGEPALFTHLGITLPVGLGWPVCLAALAGIGRCLWRRNVSGLIVLAFTVALFASAASVTMVFPRYLVPIVPPLAVFAAEAVVALAKRSPPLAAGLALVLAAPGAWRSAEFDRLAARPDTRVLAAGWGNTHFPRNARVLVCRGYGAPEFDRRTKLVDCRRDDVPLDWGRYVVTSAHPVLPFDAVSPALVHDLEARGRVVATFDPFTPGSSSRPYFYADDAFYLPFAGLGAVERGGPILTVWDILTP